MIPSRKAILALDTALLAIFLMVLAPRFTALPWHEWLGLAMALPLLLHLLLSWNWIGGTLRKLARGAPLRSYLNFGLNAALFVLVINEIVTGIMISQVALPAFGGRAFEDARWRNLHNQFLGWMRLVLAMHIAMNWSWIMQAIRKWSDRSATRWQEPSASRLTLGSSVVRSFAIVSAGVGVGAAIFYLAGPPSALRAYGQNEIARFGEAHAAGILNLGAQLVTQALFAYVGHRWLRVRL